MEVGGNIMQTLGLQHTLKEVVASTTAPYLCLRKSGPELWPPRVHHWSHDTQ